MPSLIALRAVIGASLGLGALDLVWINAVLAPEVLASEVEASAPQGAAPAPHVSATVVPAPRTPPVAAPATPAEPPRATRHAVYFATRSAELDGAARSVLAEIVAANSRADFVLEGHADHRGSETLNQRLSRERAETVAAMLAELGVEPTRMRVDAVGEADAVAGTANEVWRDRRVDIDVRTGGTPR